MISDLEKEIVKATSEVFATMVMMEVTHHEPLKEKAGQIESNITSMLGLGGEIRGMVSVHCPEVVAKGITSSFLGMEVAELDEDVKDAIGEIANMVAGNLKIFFSSRSVEVELAIPTTVIGKSFKTHGLLGATRIIIPFECSMGKFWIELKYVVNT